MNNPIALGDRARVNCCLLGSVNAHRDIPRLLALARAGRLDLSGMITDRYPLDEVDAAVDNLRRRRGIRTSLTIG